MQPLDAIGEPVRRRILELIGPGEVAAGVLATQLKQELGLSQPACSQHLKVLRDCHLVCVRVVGTSRLYQIDQAQLGAAVSWFDQLLSPWEQPLDALATELARGRRARRRASQDAVDQAAAEASEAQIEAVEVPIKMPSGRARPPSAEGLALG